jgi:hypothetical protein
MDKGPYLEKAERRKIGELTRTEMKCNLASSWKSNRLFKELVI